jgi:serine/threonine-protein kinase
MIGRTILHYQVTEKLGAGGMGEIYKARDPRLNRTVAIKALPTNAMGDSERRRRFIQEAQAASGLNHPNIITIHDILSDSDTEYMVMEYVAGRTLSELIPTGGLGVDKALRYGVQIADALAAAHAAGIVHRDLKPGNVMVTESGLVKILDFGLAKINLGTLTEEAQLTEATRTIGSPLTVEGSIIGTVSYMSPEQAQGGKIDARSDIFSFGSLMYEMVTGNKAFPGPSPIATLTAILRDEVRPIREVAPDCPPELEEIIGRAMRKAPADRWQSMQEVHGVLGGLRQKFESGILHASMIAPPPVKKPSPGRPLSATVLGILATIIIGMIGWLYWTLHRQAPVSKPAAQPAPVSAVPSAPGDKPSPLAEAPKPEADGVLTNQSVLELAGAHVPDSVIVSQIRASKTRFDLTTAGIIQLTKGGVAPAVIEAMRHPSGETVTPSPTPEVAAAKRVVPLPVDIPFEITLLEEVPINPVPGTKLHFRVTRDYHVEGEVAIAKGAAVTGEVLPPGKKNFLGRGGKPAFRLRDVVAVDGTKVKVKASPGGSNKNEYNIEPPGHRGKESLAPAGSSYLAYFDGEQTVAVKK